MPSLDDGIVKPCATRAAARKAIGSNPIMTGYTAISMTKVIGVKVSETDFEELRDAGEMT